MRNQKGFLKLYNIWNSIYLQYRIVIFVE